MTSVHLVGIVTILWMFVMYFFLTRQADRIEEKIDKLLKKQQQKKGEVKIMPDINKVMSWLEGLSQDDWRDYHSDSEVQNIAKVALELLKEKVVKPTLIREEKIKMYNDYRCPRCDQEIVCCKCGSQIDWTTD